MPVKQRCRGAAVALLLGLAAACSGGEAEASGNEAAALRRGGKLQGAAPAPGPSNPSADLAGARALVDRIYSSYAGSGPDTETAPLTPELRAAIDRQSDPEGGLGYDIFCQCQDFGETSFVIDSLVAEGGGAVARITFTNFGERRTITLHLARRDGAWLVADVHNGESSLLQGGG